MNEVVRCILTIHRLTLVLSRVKINDVHEWAAWQLASFPLSDAEYADALRVLTAQDKAKRWDWVEREAAAIERDGGTPYLPDLWKEVPR